MYIGKVHVNTAVPYDVLIGAGLLSQIGVLIGEVVNPNHVMLISDDTVYALYGQEAISALQAAGFTVFTHVIQHGEASKNMMILTEILEAAAEHLLTRKDVFVALGGGVVGDITGFAASVYMRGVDFGQDPTTLLAAVDASVGGKTAVDLVQGKNLAGTFWQPRLVVCDSGIIGNLPTELFNNGMAEVIKHGVIGDKAILECINAGLVVKQLNWLVQRNVEIKRDVVENDEKEAGMRQILNFGHTVAHAIEKMSDYTIPHGVAVGTGMVHEARLAARLGLCDDQLADDIWQYCKTYGLFLLQEITPAFIDAMRTDKKNVGDDIVFALPSANGQTVIRKMSINEVLYRIS